MTHFTMKFLMLMLCTFLFFSTQGKEITGSVKRKAAVTFGPNNSQTAFLKWGATVTILDVDDINFKIQYKDGIGFIKKSDVSYYKSEIEELMQTKLKQGAKNSYGNYVGSDNEELLITAGKCISRAGYLRLGSMAVSSISTAVLLTSQIKDPNTVKAVAYGSCAAALILIIVAEINQIQGGKLLQKKGISLSTTKNGLGMVYRF